MTFLTSIKLKAALLLLVFSLNTVRSLACAIHADRFLYAVINTVDHHKENGRTIHRSCEDDDDCKCPEKRSNEKGCCNEKVVAFDHLAKAPSHHISGNLNVPIFELSQFFLSSSTIKLTNLPFTTITRSVRNPHSPPEDIRVSIQSFQI